MQLDETTLSLQQSIRSCMSEERYVHTLGVAKCAYEMAEAILPEKKQELYIAALLHDIAKEMPQNEQIAMMKEPSAIYCFESEDLLSPALYHAFCAPYVIQRDFASFATEEILFAVCYHTVGREQMRIFEKIIFLADYIEEGRRYPDCISVREYFFSRIKHTHDSQRLLDECVLMTLDKTIAHLLNRRQYISPRTLLTRNAILGSLSHT